MHIKRRVLGGLIIPAVVILSVVSVFGFMVRNTPSANAASFIVTTEAQLISALADPGPNTDITIGADFPITAVRNITTGKNITIHSDATPRTISRDTTFINNYLFNIQAGGTLTLMDITLDGNKTGISGTLIRGLIGNAGTLNIQDGTTLQNSSVTASSIGGAINQSGVGVLNMTGGAIINNSSSVTGGGIYSTGASTVLNLSGGTINNNSSQNGGAIYLIAGATANLSGSFEIRENTATAAAGGIYLNASKLYLTGDTTITSNISGTTGGAIMAAGVAPIIDIRGNAKVNQNTAQTTGGGINSSTAAITIAESAQVNNNATRANSGGGVYISGTASLTLADSATINNNETNLDSGAHHGGGVFVTGANAQFTMTGGTIDNNTAKGSGGGVYLTQQTAPFNVTGGSISGNSAGTTGGGVMSVGVSAIFTDVDIDNNSATSGGGVYVSSAVATAIVVENGTSISNNTASADGGGIRSNNTNAETVINITGGVLEKNTAGTIGGGLASVNITSISGSPVFQDNEAGTHGGGIYMLSRVLTLVGNAQFLNNSAVQTGGGLYIGAGTSADTVAIEDTVKFDGNSAGTNGGAIWINPLKLGNLTVASGVVFANNSASYAATMLPRDVAMYATNIHTTAWTAPFTNGFNNYDIAYTGTQIDCFGAFGGAENVDRDGSTPALACLISDAAGLDKLRNFLGADYMLNHFRLTNDIDLTEYLTETHGGSNPVNGWNPIGDSTNHFDATLDGNNHVIEGLWINTDGQCAGLFGWLGTEQEPIGVFDLGIIIDNAKGGIRSTADTSVVGGLASTLRNHVKNVYVVGDLSATNTNNNIQIGGIAGRSDYGTILESYAIGSITVSGYTNAVRAGGLAGHAYYGAVYNSYSNVSIADGVAYRTGGIIGTQEGNGIVNRSYAVGPISGTSPTIGGIGGGGNATNYTENFYSTSTGALFGADGGAGDGPGKIEQLTPAQMLDPTSFVNWNVNGNDSPWFMFMNPNTPSLGLSNPYLSGISNELLIKPGGSMEYTGAAPTADQGWFGVDRNDAVRDNLKEVSVTLAWADGSAPTEPGEYGVCASDATAPRYQVAVSPICGTFTILPASSPDVPSTGINQQDDHLSENLLGAVILVGFGLVLFGGLYVGKRLRR